ncbi:hypothetical protein HIM_10468 [Hirsutella minnesotensis 3608]|uniref:Uncharacterized protein n=1 Tax=Hirsutella minnesotensis 3608 TaxID=1043627 RepID=A0A0F7ZX57_9HYPO|nr:hypothetical protein HIM_10468 [Hirsutella minnesotensis 3608]
MPQTRSQARRAIAEPNANSTTAETVDETAETAQSGQLHTKAATTSCPKKQSTIAARSIALELWSQGVPTNKITQRTGIKKGAFYTLLNKAKARGFQRGQQVLEAYVADS